jgi:hypothetical protein
MEEGEEKEKKKKGQRTKKLLWGRRFPQVWTHLAGCAVGCNY